MSIAKPNMQRKKQMNYLFIQARNLIETELKQSYEYKQLLQSGIYFPNDHLLNLSKELKLLGIPGAVLSGEQFIELRQLGRKHGKDFSLV